jgi:Cytochrome C and Quinol oxidase polypeptide I
MTGINFVTTILKTRAPGMGYMRMPVFCWTAFASNLLMVAAFPVLTATLAMLLLDRYLGFHFFSVDAQGNPMMYVNLFWVWGHPEVYILILPAFGIFSEVIATFSGKPLFGYRSMVAATMVLRRPHLSLGLRDGKRGKLQIVIGLLCTAEGCPVEVFEGNVGDPSTLPNQVDKLKQRFKLERVVLIGDRGMITAARIEETVKPAGLNFVTALRAPTIRGLAEAGTLQLSLFDQRDLAEIASPDYPGERLIACRNPLLADERARKRRDLLEATERELLHIQARVRREKRSLRGKDKIALAN